MKKLYILAIFALFIGGGMSASTRVKAVDNVNISSVTSCEQVGADIRISRNNSPKYILASSCRDAGYGKRLYKMTCVSKTQYKTEWTNPASCINTTQDVTAPVVSVVSNKITVSNNEGVTLTATASDTKGVTKIELREGSTIVKTCLNTTSCVYTFTATAQQTTERVQTFTAKAYDAAGNVSTSSVVTVSTRRLSDSVIFFTNKTNIKTGEQITAMSFASAASGISKIEIFQNSTKVKTCLNITRCTYTTTLTLPVWLNSQVYTFYARATDKNNLIQTSNTSEVTVTR